MAIIEEVEQNKPAPSSASTRKQFKADLDSSNPIGFLEKVLEFIAKETDLFKSDSLVNDVNAVVRMVKDKGESEDRKKRMSTTEEDQRVEINKNKANEINKKIEAEIEMEEADEINEAEIRKEKVVSLLTGRSVAEYEKQKAQCYAGKRVYLHGVRDGWDCEIRSLKSSFPHILLVVGCYKDDVYKKMFRGKTPRMTYQQRLESLNDCKLANLVHCVIENAPMVPDEDFKSKNNLDLVVGYDPITTKPSVGLIPNGNIFFLGDPHPRVLVPRVYSVDTPGHDFEEIQKSEPNARVVVGILSDGDAARYLGKEAGMTSYQDRLNALRTSKWVDDVILAPWVVDEDFLDKNYITYVMQYFVPDNARKRKKMQKEKKRK